MIRERSNGSRSRQAGKAAWAEAMAARASSAVGTCLTAGTLVWATVWANCSRTGGLGEPAVRLAKHRQAFVEPFDGRAKLVATDGVRAGGGNELRRGGGCLGFLYVGRGQEHIVGDFVGEAGPQPGLVRRVLQQPADEIGHAGNHLADGHVLANADVAGGDGRAKLVGHAGELLHFIGGGGEIVLFQQGQDVSDGADVVRAGGQLYAAFVRHGAAWILDDPLGHPLETGVGLVFFGPNGRRRARRARH